MADNVQITQGTGTSVASDDVSGVHFQRIKLVDGTLDSTAAISGDTVYGLDVDITRLPALVAGTQNIGDVDVVTLPALVASTANIGDVDIASIAAGETHIGEVSGVTAMVSVEFTRAANSTAYSIGDAVLNSSSALTEIALFARTTAASGYVTGARIAYSTKSVTPRIRMHIFNTSSPTLSADNALWQDKYADESKRVLNYDMPNLQTALDSTNSDMCWAEDFSMRIPFKAAAGTRSLFIGLETLDAFTPTTSDKFNIKLYGELN